MSKPLIVKSLTRWFGARLRERDKQQHFVVCLCLAPLFWLVTGSVVMAMLLTMLVGLGKEIWDEFYGSGFCWSDMVANLLGACCGLAIVWLSGLTGLFA